MTTPIYAPPVDQLLTFGECKWEKPWPDYRELGIGPEHVPELIRMACDPELNQGDSDTLEVYAPTHAWRALGQLGAETAVEPLLGLLNQSFDWDDDWTVEELPEVFGMFGPKVMPALKEFLADPSRAFYARTTVARGVAEIAKRHSESRTACVEALTHQLEKYSANDPALNGFLIGSLLDIEAVESAELIKEAFAADSVDETIVGDLYDVADELGLDVPEPPPGSRRTWVWAREDPADNRIPDIHDSDPFSRRKAMKKLESKWKQGKKRYKLKTK